MADDGEYRKPADGENDAEDEEEADETAYKTVKDAVLFAIDVSDSMLRQPPPSDNKKADRDSATRAALKCAYQLMQQRIISNPNDMMGILLYGTRASKFMECAKDESPQYPSCYLLTELDVPYAEDVKLVRKLAEDDDEFNNFMVPAKEPILMSNMLFCANQIFMTKAPNFSSRRLFLVTDNDDPHAGDKELKNAAIVRAKDLFDLGVSIELFPISQPDHEFDTARFYDDIVYRQPSDPEAPAPMVKAPKPASTNDGLSLLSSLLISVYSKLVPKRALFSNLTFELNPELKISVKGFIIFKRQEPQKSSYVYLDGETPVIATGKTKTPESNANAGENSATDENKRRYEIRKAYKFGGEQVLFTPEEMKEILNFGEPVIRLIGFKPISMLPKWATLRPSTFIYPSEEDYIGSTRTFAALQQSLVKKKKMAIVWYISRRNAAPVMAALLPGEEEVGSQGEQTLPPGLWLVQLPFVDDVRSLPDVPNDWVFAPDVLKDKMRDVMQQLQLPGGRYDPSKYPNPALQWHYRILQALALEEDVPQQPDDKTVPKYRQIDKRAGHLVIDWGETLQDEFDKHQQARVDARGALPISAPQAKRVKTAAASGDEAPMPDAEMQGHVNRDSLSKVTLPVLKTWLRSKNLSLTGNKAVLVARVESYFETKMQLD